MTLTADSPYIVARTTQLTLPDGLLVGIRPLVAMDREELASSLERVSEQGRFRRFFRVVTELTERELDYLTAVDYDNHFAWVASTGQPPFGIGLSRYVRIAEEPSIAEAAVTVTDDYQRRGIGRILLELLSESALANGITTFRGYALPENRPVLDAAIRHGLESHMEDGMARLDVPLPPPTGLEGSDVYGLLRHVASGHIKFGT